MALAELFAQMIGQKIASNHRKGNDTLNEMITTLPAHAQQIYHERYQARKKSVLIGYLCWWAFGCHYIYTGKYIKQAIFWLTLGGLFIWYLLDLFCMFLVVNSANRQIGFEIIDEIYEQNLAGSSEEAAEDRDAEQTQAKSSSDQYPSITY